MTRRRRGPNLGNALAGYQDALKSGSVRALADAAAAMAEAIEEFIISDALWAAKSVSDSEERHDRV